MKKIKQIGWLIFLFFGINSQIYAQKILDEVIAIVSDHIILHSDLEKEMEVVQMETLVGEAGPYDMVMEMGNGKPSKKIIFDKPEIEETNAIKEELRTFAEAINNDTTPIVSLEDGLLALDVAEQILEKLKMNGSIIESNIH